MVEQRFGTSDIEKVYGLVGFPLGHSFSQRFFTDKFNRENINARYLNFEISDIGELTNIIAETPSLVGFNVTIPYKEVIITMLNHLDDQAGKIGAVNTVKIFRHVKDGQESIQLKGFNTDIIGFTKSISPYLKPSDRKALVLGTGGASKAIVAGLKSMSIEGNLVSRCSGNGHYSYEDLSPQIIAEHTIIINTTPLGMWPNIDTFPDLPYEAITSDHVCFDAVYNPFPTKFLKLCEAKGATIIGGLKMLELQALAAWHIWNNESL